MHALDVLKYGNRTFLNSLEGLPEADWHAKGVCGIWSVKDIIAHLASHELVLVDVFNCLLGTGPTPYLDSMKMNGIMKFNDAEVEKRQGLSTAETLAEYKDAHARTMELAARIPPEKFRETGALPWYGMEYDLEDYIAYGYYGHKREHSAQIMVYRDELKKVSVGYS